MTNYSLVKDNSQALDHAIIAGDRKIVKKILSSKKETDHFISSLALNVILNKKDKKTLKLLLKKRISVPFTDDMMADLLNMGWKKEACIILGRSESLTIHPQHDSDVLLQIIKHGDNGTLKRISSTSGMEYDGKHSSVMIHMCKTSSLEIISKAMKTCPFDPEYDDHIFIKTAADFLMFDTCSYLIKRCKNEIPHKLHLYILMRQSGSV